jgi:alanine dehydrogenase
MVASSDNSGAFIHGSVLMPQEEMLEIKKEKKSFKIGVLADNSGFEHRVPLAPLAVEQLVNEGFEILIEQGAGVGANFSDRQFSEYGAQIVSSRKSNHYHIFTYKLSKQGVFYQFNKEADYCNCI